MLDNPLGVMLILAIGIILGLLFSQSYYRDVICEIKYGTGTESHGGKCFTPKL